jgi:hypothetical protein
MGHPRQHRARRPARVGGGSAKAATCWWISPRLVDGSGCGEEERGGGIVASGGRGRQGGRDAVAGGWGSVREAMGGWEEEVE